jgi:hypothetical protein
MFDEFPSDEEEARHHHHHAIEKLNCEGFLDRIFERVERCHKNSKLEDSNMSGMFEASFSEDLAEEVQECNDDVVQIDNTGESQFQSRREVHQGASRRKWTPTSNTRTRSYPVLLSLKSFNLVGDRRNGTVSSRASPARPYRDVFIQP